MANKQVNTSKTNIYKHPTTFVSRIYIDGVVLNNRYLHQKRLQDIVSNNTQQDNTLCNYIKLIQIIFNTKMLICMEFMFILANT